MRKHWSFADLNTVLDSFQTSNKLKTSRRPKKATALFIRRPVTFATLLQRGQRRDSKKNKSHPRRTLIWSFSSSASEIGRLFTNSQSNYHHDLLQSTGTQKRARDRTHRCLLHEKCSHPGLQDCDRRQHGVCDVVTFAFEDTTEVETVQFQSSRRTFSLILVMCACVFFFF